MSPKIAHSLIFADAQRLPRYLSTHLLGTAIENRYRGVSRNQWLHPNLNCPGTTGPLPPDAQRILINSDHFLIEQDRSDIRTHVADVVSGDQRSSDHRPQAKVGLVLVDRHTSVPDLEHIGIIPVAGASKLRQVGLRKADLRHRSEEHT